MTEKSAKYLGRLDRLVLRLQERLDNVRTELAMVEGLEQYEVEEAKQEQAAQFLERRVGGSFGEMVSLINLFLEAPQ